MKWMNPNPSILRSALALASAAVLLALAVVAANAREAVAGLSLELPPGGVAELALDAGEGKISAAFHRDAAGRLTPLELSVRGDEVLVRLRDEQLEPGPGSLILDRGSEYQEIPLVLIQPAGVEGALEPIELADDRRERTGALQPVDEIEDGELAAAARNERRLNHPPVGPNPDSAWLSIRPGGAERPTRVELGRNPESDTIRLGGGRAGLPPPRELAPPAPGELSPAAERLAVVLAEAPLDATTRERFERELREAAARTGEPEERLRRQAFDEAVRRLHGRLNRLARERSEAIAREGLLRSEAAAAQRHWRRHLPPNPFEPHVPDARAAGLVATGAAPSALESRAELRGWLRELDGALERAEAEAAAAVRLHDEAAAALDARLRRLERWTRVESS